MNDEDDFPQYFLVTKRQRMAVWVVCAALCAIAFVGGLFVGFGIWGA